MRLAGGQNARVTAADDGKQPSRRRSAGLALALLAVLAVLAGCSRETPPPPVPPPAPAPAAAAPDADPAAALVLPEVMEWVVDPAAAVLAAAADQHGWAALAPRSDEAWQAVADAAAELQRSGELLLRPALAQDRGDWLESAAMLREGAVAAAAAARRHDPRGLYLAGLQVKAGCQGCHARHAPPLDGPRGPTAPSGRR